MESDPSKSVAAFYAGRSIFITGGTGFMGKVLIEKILRSCPDVQEIFLLMRSKKGMSIDDRLRKMLTLPLFDKMREKDPSVFKKLIPVTGDVSEEGLGLPTIERRVLIEKVSVIFHSAASVRFDDPLKDAILMNTRGTREVCILAASMKKLAVLLHVSTTYANTDKPVIDEILYPPHANWKKTIKIAETIDNHTLNIMTAKYLGKLPNTYTFTKQLAEHVINDYSGVIPSVIFRPSVVISTVSEPVSGWLDNFNGPVGMMIGGGKGVLRALSGDPRTLADYMPVDIAIKAMLVTAWQRGITTITKDPSPHVYNCSSSGRKVITNGDLIELGFRTTEEIPFDDIIWRPATTMHFSRSVYYANFLIFQLLPALIIDAVLKLSRAEPRLLKLQRKIYTANFALEYFLREDWQFKNNNLTDSLAKLPVNNKPEFDFDLAMLDIPWYFRDLSTIKSPCLTKVAIEGPDAGRRNLSSHVEFLNCAIGAKLYLLKEDMDKLPEARAHYNKMWWIDRALTAWFGVFVTWAVVASGLLAYISGCITAVFDILA